TGPRLPRRWLPVRRDAPARRVAAAGPRASPAPAPPAASSNACHRAFAHLAPPHPAPEPRAPAAAAVQTRHAPAAAPTTAARHHAPSKSHEPLALPPADRSRPPLTETGSAPPHVVLIRWCPPQAFAPRPRPRH